MFASKNRTSQQVLWFGFEIIEEQAPDLKARIYHLSEINHILVFFG
jgi:hypothetical protein